MTSSQSPTTGAGLGTAGDSVGTFTVNLPVDELWLGRLTETAILPELAIIDAHHHLWDKPGHRYMPTDLLDDLTGGHTVVGTVFIEAGAMYRSAGPEHLRPVGETEIVAAMAEGWPTRDAAKAICAGIVAHADLTGAAVEDVLVAHVEAGRGRLRGIRQNAAWDPAPSIQLRPSPPRGPIQPQLLADSRFREGFSRLAPHGLTFDAWLYQGQLPELIDLVGAFPETRIIVDHCGGPVRTGPYRGRDDELHADWRQRLIALAAFPNVFMKIGGLAMRTLGFDFRERDDPPHSSELVGLWRPYVEGCIEIFGTKRCMFESNFPVDKAYCSYNSCWNAFKSLTLSASAEERQDLFHDTANRVYGLNL